MMIPSANSSDIDGLKARADIIEEVDGLTTYLGFCDRNTALTSEPKWSICKISQSSADYPIITTFKWATGLCSYNLVWDDRADYEYIFKKF